MKDKDLDTGIIQSFQKYSEKISKSIFYFYLDFLKFYQVPLLIAPYEADYQLYKLY